MGYHGGAVSHNGSGSSTSKQQRLGDAATAASSGSAGVVNPLAKQGKPAPPAARAGAEKPFEGASTPAVGTSAPPSAEPEVHTVSSELIIAVRVAAGHLAVRCMIIPQPSHINCSKRSCIAPILVKIWTSRTCL
jgi:hypothetical protein